VLYVSRLLIFLSTAGIYFKLCEGLNSLGVFTSCYEVLFKIFAIRCGLVRRSSQDAGT